MDPNAIAYVQSRIEGRKPTAGIILGSGLCNLGDRITDPVIIRYTDVPGFFPATAIGHEGNFICGQLGGRCVIAMQGRYHLYEGYTLEDITMPFMLMMGLGIKELITTNASGALNPAYKLGDIMVLNSHINMLDGNILKGKHFGKEYYDSEIMERFIEAAALEGVSLRCGCYIAVTGPSYETPSEHHYYNSIGGDAIGMSTVPDIELAKKMGVKVLAISIVADAPQYYEDKMTGTLLRKNEPTDGEEVIKAAEVAAERLGYLLETSV